jgi:hypothetical protein
MQPARIVQMTDKPPVDERPTLDQVVNYIQFKMNWPGKFTKYYSEKFWNFYESKGWKVGNQSMKNWKACFNGQWQHLKHENDFKALSEAIRDESKAHPETSDKTVDKTIQYLNDRLNEYFKHPTWITDETLNSIYDYLKANKPFSLPAEQVKICRSMGEVKGKAQAVKFLLETMIKERRKFI